MDLQAFSSQMGGHGNPFLVDSFPDPICKINLKETAEFVKSLPTAAINGGGPESRRVVQRKKGGGESSVPKRGVVEAPSTPGRPIFSFSVGSFSRKSFPSKWDDAEKWVVNGSNSCHESPAHIKLSSNHSNGVTPKEEVDEKSSSFQGSSNGVPATSDVLLKDKFTSEVETITCPNLRHCESMKEGFLFGKSMNNVAPEVKHRDIGTEMTPIGSSTTSRCHTPFKSSSPARHNTPASRSGPLAVSNESSSSSTVIDIVQLQECHLAKLHVGTTGQYDSVTTNWSSREEEEEDISKSLRHFEMSNECRRSVSESRACPSWEEEEKTKHCLRYQRELAKIQAWVNLQNAKSEAQSKKLEVKIQKMRSNLEEKLMKRMSTVHRKAEEWRAVAQLQHSEQIQKVSEQTQKMMMMMNNRKNINNVSRANSCGCFPCNNHHM
ncbi:PREDICTED: uncharacterized protein LOC109187494 isoform X2 [Ipomoea nil]|uniref:uncharacterized protein LOC109187494 isoform X2 n=1 Tax=Ipomoea nil TaxID=35883 RepID=UPI0009019483|nr:PREDICTED: uncharacterized protein LOC109187494 isoform X2 [Ipomoea nil]